MKKIAQPKLTQAISLSLNTDEHIQLNQRVRVKHGAKEIYLMGLKILDDSIKLGIDNAK